MADIGGELLDQAFGFGAFFLHLTLFALEAAIGELQVLQACGGFGFFLAELGQCCCGFGLLRGQVV